MMDSWVRDFFPKFHERERKRTAWAAQDFVYASSKHSPGLAVLGLLGFLLANPEPPRDDDGFDTGVNDAMAKQGARTNAAMRKPLIDAAKTAYETAARLNAAKLGRTPEAVIEFTKHKPAGAERDLVVLHHHNKAHPGRDEGANDFWPGTKKARAANGRWA